MRDEGKLISAKLVDARKDRGTYAATAKTKLLDGGLLDGATLIAHPSSPLSDHVRRGCVVVCGSGRSVVSHGSRVWCCRKYRQEISGLGYCVEHWPLFDVYIDESWSAAPIFGEPVGSSVRLREDVISLEDKSVGPSQSQACRANACYHPFFLSCPSST